MKFNKWTLGLLAFAAILCTTAARAQTGTNNYNEFYKAGDFTVGIAPVFSTPSVALAGQQQFYGLSAETDYWQTKSTATGIELGTRDVRNFADGCIDHVTAIEKVRVVVAPNTPIFNRLALIGYTGAEENLFDGSKGVIIGGGFEYACTQNVRLTVDLAHSFETQPANTCDRLRAGLSYRF